MSNLANRVLDTARKYVGVREKPLGSNTDGGGPIDRWQKAWGLRRVPWCGCFADGVYREAGVDDDGIAHPSTQSMYDRARALGAVVDRPYPGCFFVYPGTHTGIVVRDLGGGVVETIEGNTSDSVAYRRRAYGPGTGLYFLAPRAIRVGVKPEPPARLYYVEDPSAKPVLRGPWRSKKARDRALARLPKARRARARAVRVGPGKYGFLEGARRLYGPWDSKDARDDAHKTLEARLGRNLRRVSKPARSSAKADALGKTV